MQGKGGCRLAKSRDLQVRYTSQPYWLWKRQPIAFKGRGISRVMQVGSISSNLQLFHLLSLLSRLLYFSVCLYYYLLFFVLKGKFYFIKLFLIIYFFEILINKLHPLRKNCRIVSYLLMIHQCYSISLVIRYVANSVWCEYMCPVINITR